MGSDRKLSVIVWTVAALAVAIVALRASGYPRDAGLREIADSRPAEAPKDGYVSSKTCRPCHPDQYASWHDSYHRRMTQVATPDAVAADLDGLELELSGRRYRFERRGERYWVDMDQGEGTAGQQRPVVMTTGSHHRQWIWYSLGRGRRLGAVPFIYLIEERQWVPRIAAFMLPPDPEWVPTHNLGLWGASCVSCHTTHGELASGTDADPRTVEFGIACEACHGAADEHVRSNRKPQRRYRHHLNEDRDDTIVNPKHVSHRRSAEVCGQCHSVSLMAVRSAYRPDLIASRSAYRPGDDLTDFARSIDRGNPLEPYARWPDGLMRSGGREYDALTATPCFERGEMSCLSCHSMHRSADDPRPPLEWANDQLHPGMDSDEACLQCHQTLEADHSHHEPASSGSRCYNCHMPYTNYALLKAIRNHQVAGPTVTESVKYGRPNACNLCHMDKSLAWSAEHLARWYETPSPTLTEDEQNLSASVLWLVSGDAGQRALTAWHMGWKPAQEISGPEWFAPYLAQLLDDPYASVRFIAYRSLRSLPGFEDFEYDYVGTAEERNAAAHRAVRIWRDGEPPAPKAPDAVLVHPNGVLGWDEFSRLLARRDDRPVNWIE